MAINLSDSTPAAPSGSVNGKWQKDSSGNVSVSVPPMGASGASHAPGIVPDPGSTAGTTHFLREDGTWAVPVSTGTSKYTTSWTSQTSVTVTHNLGTTAVLVQVYDTSGVLWQPESVTATSTNVVTLTFGAAFSGSVVIVG